MLTPEQLKAAREKAQKLLNDMRSINSVAASEKRTMNAEETAKYEAMYADFNDTRAEIQRAEQLQEATRYMGEIVTEQVRDLGGNGEAIDLDAGYKREFLAMVRGGEFDARMMRNMNVGTPADGGYTVPTVLINAVLRALGENVLMRRLGKVITTSSTTVFPIGGAKPTFALVAENGAYPTTDTKFGAKTLNAYKVGGIIRASEELLNDSGINIEEYITMLMNEGIGEFEEDKFINGAGVSDFTGIAAGTVGVTSASPTAITSDEVLDMYYSIASKYRPSASWVVSDSFEKAVMKLKDTTGRYLWNMGIGDGVPAMLNNRPIYNSSFMPAIAATAVTAAFGDMSYFQIADRGGIAIKRLNELFAGTGEIGFQVTKRGDSKIMLDEAIKTFKMHA